MIALKFLAIELMSIRQFLVWMSFFSIGQFILGGNLLSLLLVFGSIHLWEAIFKEAIFHLWQSIYWNLYLELDISFWRWNWYIWPDCISTKVEDLLWGLELRWKIIILIIELYVNNQENKEPTRQINLSAYLLQTDGGNTATYIHFLCKIIWNDTNIIQYN